MRQFEMILQCPLLVLDWVVVNCQVRLIFYLAFIKIRRNEEEGRQRGLLEEHFRD